MSRESALFYSIAIPLGVAGTVIAKLLGWGDGAVFLAGMGSGFVVMFIFMLRERNHEDAAGSQRLEERGLLR